MFLILSSNIRKQGSARNPRVQPDPQPWEKKIYIKLAWKSTNLQITFIFQILQHNCHSVMQCRQGEQVSMEAVGTALYTSMAFLNHSCDTNTIKYFEGDRLVLVATRPILRGQEITDNYGPHFTLTARIARNKWLKASLYLFFYLHIGCTFGDKTPFTPKFVVPSVHWRTAYPTLGYSRTKQFLKSVQQRIASTTADNNLIVIVL